MGRWLVSSAIATLALVTGTARADLTSELVATGLDDPLYATFVPGDAGRLFIVEQPGVIRILDIASQPPALLGAAFLDIQARVNDTANEQGLLGPCIPPRFRE